MFRTLIESHILFRLLIAVPAVVMLSRLAVTHGGLGQVLQDSGVWGERMLIATLAVTPICMLFKGQAWTTWLVRRRRDLGLAAFFYTVLHLAAYVVRQNNIAVILYDLPYKEYLTGWIGLATMLVLALTSNTWAFRTLGTAWKPVQQLIYVTAIASYLHWLWIKLDHWPAYLHFAPLVLLEAFRLWYNFAKPNRQRPQE